MCKNEDILMTLEKASKILNDLHQKKYGRNSLDFILNVRKEVKELSFR